ncbi:MAG TPA: TIGR04295 family B12-binding domain-containing radical SAM protein [Terriglobales bacterium]|jgi:anaerobic magnesium-protoporphyrin IX monomethyl ester cyclase|nr:TIGR04295 family B12-binding domain-containing radical SAM protein [Terriglobales bacterium]
MRYAFVNPNWDFGGSTYFGCQEPHYPLELLFAFDQVVAAGGEALLLDAQVENFSTTDVAPRVRDFRPDFLVIPTAPSYLFWRCPPPELRVPQEWFAALQRSGVTVAIGPHPSATPSATMRKTKCEVALRGEPDQTLPQLAVKPWHEISGCCWRDSKGEHISSDLGVTDMKALGALDFHNYPVELHAHRHHVFSGHGRGAELEFARGCPWSCTFCNKTLFRDKFRERSVEVVLAEIDCLISRGVDYIYFIDEIFGVGKDVLRLLEGIAERHVKIGFQSRIDLWTEETLDLLGRAHCISMECGIESITEQGREGLKKNCRIDTRRIGELLIYARQRIPWVQANLILTQHDNKAQIRQWQDQLKSHDVWVSEPVPMFPFPGSPLFVQTFGESPDDNAWERAHHFYMSQFQDKGFSDIQEQQPAAIEDLECMY